MRNTQPCRKYLREYHSGQKELQEGRSGGGKVLDLFREQKASKVGVDSE